ncbi:NAD(P)/FAD-dependent oxidoreductase [Siphonobacter aquaeclarae]|uniref:NADH:ubiquinone reductase (non-electrogenic) n=1 Tax=Siphonobacter aquaeclarae TaxID=563176 RepID=A0A1G9WQJ9_9BACT|nr:NAD(P)/FAD-dependent oxidoreductase [Siphonobacter aquaeclarae]SDM86466.1 NADH dehydrogenase [Siphonobacter aquaeclarae]
MNSNIPKTSQKRVVIIGAGFGGLALARKLSAYPEIQTVLLDKNNFHQFQPLFYQVAMAGLEPSSISFPLRKAFQNKLHVHIRVTEVLRIDTDKREVVTSTMGGISYDYLVIAAGAGTNFFGMQNIIDRALPMKSVGEALALRNRMLENFERALIADDIEDRQGLMNVVVVGGGPTGVELSGTLAEMKVHILPKDYPELDFRQMQIYLVEAGAELLGPMSVESQVKSKQYLQNLGVHVLLNSRVTDYDGQHVHLLDGTILRTDNLVWAAGVKANTFEGIPVEKLGRGGRLKANEFCQVEGYDNIFAIGDVAILSGDDKFPGGHPQLAQPAIQQGKILAENLLRLIRGEEMKGFRYKDLGSMATVGRNLAVVDLPFLKFQGFLAWMTWMFVHLMSIVGVKNRLLIFINWIWSYITYDQSLRLIIRAKEPKLKPVIHESVEVNPS